MKKALVIFASVLVLFTAVIVGSFWLVPEGRLNALIARQLSGAFGYDVTVSGRPSVRFFPLMSVSFGPMRVTTGDGDEAPIMEVERAEGRLSMTSLWRGNPSLRFIVMNQADITVVRDETGKTNWSTARFFQPDEDNPSNGPSLQFSSRLRFVTFVDSRLKVIQPALSKTEVIELDDVMLAGPPRSADLTVSGKMEWRGRALEGELRLSEPNAFMGGSSSDVSVSMTSESASFVFRGQSQWDEKLRGEGVLEATIFNAAELSNWVGLEAGGVLPKGEFSLLGDGEFSADRITLRPVALRLGDGKADGRLALDFKKQKFGLSGTLAFDTLKIGQLDDERGPAPSLVEQLLLMGNKGPEVDLRLSSETANIMGQSIDDLALTVISNENSFLLNIGSAKFTSAPGEGLTSGQLRGEVDSIYADTGTSTKANITISDFNLEALEQSIGVSVPLEGTLSLSVQATTAGNDRRSMEDNLNLKMIGDIRDGTLRGVNFSNVFEIAGQDDLVLLNTPEGGTEFTAARLSGTISPSGSVDDATLEIKDGKSLIRANGLINIGSDQLSMVGSAQAVVPDQTDDVADPDGQNDLRGAKALSITLGGSFTAPRLTSVGDIRLPPSGSNQ